MSVPDRPKIYHIVHVDNLASIVADGCLWPDAVMVKRQGGAVIGNNEIKADRLRLPVDCHAGTCVGDYVPFYLCPRSVMLYVISKRNQGMSRSLLNIAKRPLPRLTLRGVSLTSKDAVS
jgi:hypothetical protein